VTIFMSINATYYTLLLSSLFLSFSEGGGTLGSSCSSKFAMKSRSVSSSDCAVPESISFLTFAFSPSSTFEGSVTQRSVSHSESSLTSQTKCQSMTETS
jgi:hypothetical protein